MSDVHIPNDSRLSRALVAALRECAEYAPHRPYIWRPKTMQKLEARGLVAPDSLMYAGKVPYHVTDKGREFLSALKETP
jgi:hypothetical protein